HPDDRRRFCRVARQGRRVSAVTMAHQRNVRMRRLVVAIALVFAASAHTPLFSQSFTAETFSGLRARSIGPAVTSGRVMTIAVDPANTSTFYVGAASGGVWKTANGGATWQPVFDTQGSFSIGWVTLD